MSNRRKTGIRNRTVAYLAAGVIHVGLLAALLFNYTSKNEKIEAHDAPKVDTINASLIDEKDIKDQQAKLTKLEKDRQRKKRDQEKRERDRLNEIKQQAKDQQNKVDDLKKQQELEKAKVLQLEDERNAIALKKKKEEDERKKKAAEQKKKEAREKARLKKIEQQRVEKQKELDRIQREQEDYKERARLNALLAEEEAEQMRRAAERIAKERTAKITSLYSSRIQAAVQRFWRVAPGTNVSTKPRVNIKLSPLGEVISVRIIESSGLAEYDQSLKAAITQASPLPIPTIEEDAQAHTIMQDVTFTFKPN